jgi:hypothetical protein
MSTPSRCQETHKYHWLMMTLAHYARTTFFDSLKPTLLWRDELRLSYLLLLNTCQPMNDTDGSSLSTYPHPSSSYLKTNDSALQPILSVTRTYCFAVVHQRKPYILRSPVYFHGQSEGKQLFLSDNFSNSMLEAAGCWIRVIEWVCWGWWLATCPSFAQT